MLSFLPKTYAPACPEGFGEAPINIALVKYWGKRDKSLNLPENSSFSVSIPGLGTQTRIHHSDSEVYVLNGKTLDDSAPFAKRLKAFLDLLRPSGVFYHVNTTNTVPTGAGLASSASGFAALVKALDHYYGWCLSKQHLSVLARLGSGSACRSLEEGFVHWQKGVQADGLDSYGQKLDLTWPDLCVGFMVVDEGEKPMGSREAMNITAKTSPLYKAWADYAEGSIDSVIAAIKAQDFRGFGELVQQNALTMFATMISSSPGIIYWQKKSLEVIEKIQKFQKEGMEIYFTEDAGPNLKLLFKKDMQAFVKKEFSDIQIVELF